MIEPHPIDPPADGDELRLTSAQIDDLRAQVALNTQTSARFPRLQKIAYRDAAMIGLLLRGLTANEICDLRLLDLNLLDGILSCRSGDGGTRTVKIDPETRRYLTLYLRDVEPDERVMLFVSQRGAALDPRSIQRAVSSLGKQIGVYLVPGRLTGNEQT